MIKCNQELFHFYTFVRYYSQDLGRGLEALEPVWIFVVWDMKINLKGFCFCLHIQESTKR